MKLHSLDHALSLIADNPEFSHVVKDGYSYIDYNYETDKTFENKELREIRGLIYDLSGRLIRRPLSKFFNYGTKHASVITNINDWYALEKLDGSMISPFMVGDQLKIGTRAGETEVSRLAEAFVKDKPNYINFMRRYCESGVSTIFEYIGPDNRIVLNYPESNLILISARKIHTGESFSYEDLAKMCENYDIPLVKRLHFDELAELIQTVAEMEDEGYVLVNRHTNERVKIKSPHYCQIHKARSQILQEKDLIKLILDKKLDDVKPFLPEDDLAIVTAYETQFYSGIKEYITTAIFLKDKIIEKLDVVNKGEFAKEAKKHPNLDWALFDAFDGRLTIESVIKRIERKLGSQTGVNEIRYIFDISQDFLTNSTIIL